MAVSMGCASARHKAILLREAPSWNKNMRYLEFRISNYRAISKPLTIAVEKYRLVPIIGINESGKTTILHAIMALDPANDGQLSDELQLRDTENLYALDSLEPKISAKIQISAEEYSGLLTWPGLALTDEDLNLYAELSEYIVGGLWVTRNLATRRFELDELIFPNKDINHEIGNSIISTMPWIMYFDDFQDSIDEDIPIVKNKHGNPDGWLAIVDEIFKRVKPEFSVFDLASMDSRKRASVISEANQVLNRTLTAEWSRFSLGEESSSDKNLRLVIAFNEGGEFGSFRMQIEEPTASGASRTFYLRNRSKGFYWFCNFVLKLEFNSKTVDDTQGAIYLLDEPGSYLHSSAQSRLCEKLKYISQSNTVIYCTHSQYLLDPRVIPLSSVHVAMKDADGSVELIRYHEFGKLKGGSAWAFQPIVDALRIEPFATNLDNTRILLVEGETDHYAIEMMKGSRRFGVMPSTGAGSIQYLVSMMIGWHVQFKVVWDDDAEGKKSIGSATKHFGTPFANTHFLLLPGKRKGQRKKTIEDYFSSEDQSMIKTELDLPDRASFKKAIPTLFYSRDREQILTQISSETRGNFDLLFDKIGFD